MRNVNVSRLMEESAIMGLPYHYSIFPSQLQYQIKIFWPKAIVLYEQLLIKVPHATLCPIRNSMIMFFVY